MEAGDFKKAFPKLAHRLGDRNVELLATLMSERAVPAGSALVEVRVPTDALFLVVDGEFRVEVDRADGAFEIGRIGHGKWIGEIALFSDDHTPTSRIVAITPSSVLGLKHDQFWSAKIENPGLVSALTREFVDHMSEQVRAADELITRCLKRGTSAHASPPSQA
ncbi:Crp/Fnr family transcriptional regulator [Thiobacillus sp.]